jgi:hypothetical protein
LDSFFSELYNIWFIDVIAIVQQNVFGLLVDTGSANTAVVTEECCAATSKVFYSCKDSSTCQSTPNIVEVNYISGSWR